MLFILFGLKSSNPSYQKGSNPIHIQMHRILQKLLNPGLDLPTINGYSHNESIRMAQGGGYLKILGPSLPFCQWVWSVVYPYPVF